MKRLSYIKNPRVVTFILLFLTLLLIGVAGIVAYRLQQQSDLTPSGQAGTPEECRLVRDREFDKCCRDWDLSKPNRCNSVDDPTGFLQNECGNYARTLEAQCLEATPTPTGELPTCGPNQGGPCQTPGGLVCPNNTVWDSLNNSCIRSCTTNGGDPSCFCELPQNICRTGSNGVGPWTCGDVDGVPGNDAQECKDLGSGEYQQGEVCRYPVGGGPYDANCRPADFKANCDGNQMGAGDMCICVAPDNARIGKVNGQDYKYGTSVTWVPASSTECVADGAVITVDECIAPNGEQRYGIISGSTEMTKCGNTIKCRPRPNPSATPTPTAPPTATPTSTPTNTPTTTPTPTDEPVTYRCENKRAYRNEASNTAGNYQLTTIIPTGSTVAAGDLIVFALRANSNNPSGTWTDVLDSRFDYVDGQSGVNYNATNRTITANATRRDIVFRVRVRADASGTITNTATFRPPSGQGSSSNCNVSLVVTTTTTPPSIACESKRAYRNETANTAGSYQLTNLLAPGSQVNPGDQIVFNLRANPATLAGGVNATWSDVLDPKLEYIDGDTGITYNAATRTVSANVTGAGYNRSFRVRVAANAAPGTISNSAVFTPASGGGNPSTCNTTLVIPAPNSPQARCENLQISAGPYTPGSRPTITVRTSGVYEADYTYRVTMSGDDNTNDGNGNYNYQAQRSRTDIGVGANGATRETVTDTFTVDKGLVQTNPALGATYRVTLADARLATDNSTLTNTEVCVAEFRMLPQGYSVVKQALEATNDVTVNVVEPGDTFRYRIALTNTSQAAVNNITITDTIEAGLINKFTIGTISDGGQRNANVITWTGLNVAVGETKYLTINLTVNQSFFEGMTICSDVVTNSVSSNPNPVTPPTPIDVTIYDRTCSEGFMIEKSANPTTVSPSGTVTYTAVVTNTGQTTAPIIRIVDTVPTGFAYRDNTSVFVGPNNRRLEKNPTVNGNTLTWEFAANEQYTLAPDQELTLTYQMTASSQSGSYTNVICLENPSPENPEARCDEATVVITVNPVVGITSGNLIKIIGVMFIGASILVYLRLNQTSSMNYSRAGTLRSRSRRRVSTRGKSFSDTLDDIVQRLKK